MTLLPVLRRLRKQHARVHAFLVFALSLLTAVPPAPAADVLRPGGSGGGAAPAVVAPGVDPVATAQALAAGRANAGDVLARAAQASQSVQAMQDAARALAISGPNNLGINPHNPAQQLPDVPNGLGVGGLQVDPAVATNAALWSGANAPTQATSSAGHTTVTVEQTAQQALLNWRTFNIGKETTLAFDQSAGGANAGQWIAFNFVNDPSGVPSQILGSIQAQGQVYVINQNGIIFGGSSTVNTHTLVASSLPINSNLVGQGLLNNPDAQFLFTALPLPQGGDGTPAYTPPAPPAGGRIGDVTVQAGAKIEVPTSASNVGGRVMLVGPNVTNNGSISTPDGQTILAAGLQVGVTAHSSSDASLRGLDVHVGAVVDPASLIPPYAGAATNNGLIDTPRGNTTITGKEVNQNGAVTSTTSVALNGRVDLLANYGAITNTDANSKATHPFLFSSSGHVSLGAGSVTRILPEWASTEKITGTELALRSQVNIQGLTARFGTDSVLLAPNAQVSVKAGVWDFVPTSAPLQSFFVYSGGQIYLDAGAIISVAGSTDVEVPVTQNLITLELRAAELADSPLQRNGALRGQTITVDIRETGVYNGKTWVGTPLANVSGYVGLIERTVAQLTVAGGTVDLHSGGSVVMQNSSRVDTSAGWINYTGGLVQTTKVISGGYVIDISQATPNLVYDGVYTPGTTLRDLTWAVSTSFINPLSPASSYHDPGHVQGADGGKLSITTASAALDGTFIGRTVQGPSQRVVGPALSEFSLKFESQRFQRPAYLPHSPTPPTLTFQSGVAQVAAAPFALDAAGSPLALSAERLADVYLSPELLATGGFGSLSVQNGDGRIIVPADVTLSATLHGHISLIGANLDILGSITAPGGSIGLQALNIGIAQRADLIAAGTLAVEPPPNAGRGIIRLGSGTRLSTAGTLMDDRGSVAGFWLPAYANDGGAISLKAYDIDLPSGSIMDVSGGVRMSETGVATFGNAGLLTLAAGQDPELKYITGGRFIQFGASLRGYSGAEGGTLSLLAPLLQVGGAALHAESLLLQPEFFTQGGFAHYQVGGLGIHTGGGGMLPAVYIAPGVTIAPVADSFVLAEGAALATTILKKPVGLRSTMSLTLQASGVAGIAGLEVRGDIVLDAGSLITTDPGATVALRGQTVAVLGSISTPGGHIEIEGGDDSFSVFANSVEALATVFIGPSSMLSAVGTRVLVPDLYDRRVGHVLDGGTISIKGNIIAAAGAVMDVSGTSSVLDLDLPATHPLATYHVPVTSGLTTPLYTIGTVPVTVDSHGGTITLAGSQLLASDATLRGFAGGATALGGTLSVSSGRFYLPEVPQPLLDTNLLITQSGPVIHTLLPSDATAIGRALEGPGGSSLISRGYFAADSFNHSGMDSLTLGGKIEFQGAANITARGRVALGGAGVLFADAPVSIQAGMVALGTDFVPPQLPEDAVKQVPFVNVPPTTGSGSLSIAAGHVELGSLALQNVGAASITAVNGEIVGNGVLSIAGHITLTAGQIYAPTATSFTVAAYDYLDGAAPRTGSITTRLSGGVRQLPLSAGSTLSLFASTIHHAGVLRAPFGTLRLGWDGTGPAPRELLTGGTLSFPVTTRLTLAAASVTSVSAIDPITGQGVTIPYGASLDGTSWIDPRGVDITASGLPEKQVLLQGLNIDTQSGATVDLRGGGDLMAWRWIEGNGGSRDILATDGSFAILPGYQFNHAAWAAYNDSTSTLGGTNLILGAGPGYVNDTLQIGDRIYLAGSASLAAGVYTLLPARYALLPGAVLVTPKSTEAPLGLREAPGNISLVSGYRFNDLNTSRGVPTLASRFEVVGQGVIHARSDYDLFYGSSFFQQAASRLSLPVSRLPQDSGYLLLQGTQSMVLNASVISTPLSTTGRGASIDITAPLAILITADGSGGGHGVLALSARTLSAFGAESLLIGGRRVRDGSTINVSTQSTSLTISNAGAALTARDVTLVTQGALTLSPGSQVVSAGAATTADVFNITGDGALLRVAQGTAASITRSGTTSAAGPLLSIAAGAQVSGANVIFDSTSAMVLDADALISGGRYTLGSNRISLQLDSPGTLPPAPGLIITGGFLASLQNASALTLQSYTSLDVYGTGAFGGAGIAALTLSAAQIRGFNQAGGTVTFAASDILLANPSSGTSAGIAAAATGSLVFDAATLRLGSNQVALDQFSIVNLNASQSITGQGTGGLAVQDALIITTPQISGTAGAVRTLTAGGDLSLLSTGAPSTTTTAGLGSTLSITGANVQVGTVLRLPSGSLSIRSTTGDLNIRSTLDVSGTAQTIYDVVRHTDAGEVILEATTANVVIGVQGLVNVSAQAGGGNAGRLSISSPAGSFINNGTLIGAGGTGGVHGSFELDTASLTSLSALAGTLSAASFTQSQLIRVRGGSVVVDGTSRARTFRLSADQGSITVTGIIDASGSTGGAIDLSANGSVTVSNGARLTVAAQDFNSAGKGGSISLEAGTTRGGVVGAGSVDIQTGSTLDLSVASKVAGGETTVGSSAYQGKFSGTLHLRAPQNPTFNDLLVSPINGSIVGASSILVEGFRLYSYNQANVIIRAGTTSLPGETLTTTTLQGHASSFMGGHNTMLGRLLANNAALEDVFVLAPGVEIVNSGGDVSLGSTSATTLNDWNLSTFRFGPKNAPGVLTLRATGNVNFHNALSDAFTPQTTGDQNTRLWLARTMTNNALLPVNTQSWSYRITAGADAGAADFRRVQPLSALASGSGSIIVGKTASTATVTGGNSALTSTLINGGSGLFQVVRTGSGDIDLNAARDVRLMNQFASIYTAGTRVTDPTLGGTFQVSALNQSAGVDTLGAAQQNYPALYSMAGGNVSISAGGSIERTGAAVSRQLPNNWLYRRGYVDPATGQFATAGFGAAIASTSWWVDYSNFFEGIGTLGGGNVTLTAGANVVNIDALAPTNARASAGTPANPLALNQTLLELGGGDVTVRAGGNIDGGVYYVERGSGILSAGGQITTSSVRSPGQISAATGLNAVLNSNAWLPTTLFIGKGGFDVSARGDLLLGPVANALLMPQGVNNTFWLKTWFSTYAASSHVGASSLGGTVTLRQSAYVDGLARPLLEAWLLTQHLKTNTSSAFSQPWLRLTETSVVPFRTLLSLLPPTMQVIAYSGGIDIAGNATLFPSATGTLDLLARGAVDGLRPLGQDANTGLITWGASNINVSDALPSSVPGALNPFAYQGLPQVGTSANQANVTNLELQFLSFIDILFSESGATLGSQALLKNRQARHSAGLLHLNDTSPVRVYASGGGLAGLTLYTPKAARLLAAQDISDVALYLQNLHATDVSTVAAGRDIIAYNASTTSRTAATRPGNIVVTTSATGNALPLAGDIQISGPGLLQVLAGRNLDLGTGARSEATGLALGITSIGNGRNPYLPFEGASVIAGAGTGFASSLASSSLNFASFITTFVQGPKGADYLAEVGGSSLTPSAFAALPSEQQRRVALEIFYLVLRDAGRDVNQVGSSGYDSGYAAIDALFPGTTWGGSISTQFRDIRTKNGGSISLFAPGGGLALAASVPVGTTPGIITDAGGDISVFTKDSVGIGISRIFTLRGGDIIIWSSEGDIAAGSSSKTVQAAPPTRVLIDPQSADVATDLAGLATGGGIGVLASVKGVVPGSVDLIAPKGVVDAGDAGIRATGNLNIAATQVLNAGNISAGGTASGTPVASVSAPNMGAVSSAATAGAATNTTATTAQRGAQDTQAPLPQQLPSIITVEVLGYGGGDDEDESQDEEERRRRKAAEQNGAE